MFNCKLCKQKDLHIADLQAQVETLKKIALPNQDNKRIPLQSIEADKIMSGSDEPLRIEDDKDALEAAAIFSGSYDNF